MNRGERINHGLIERHAVTLSNGERCTVRRYPDRIAIQLPVSFSPSWHELQRIKHEIVGNVEAFEFYPVEHDVVDLTNTRHLWFDVIHDRNHPEFLSKE
jgi:hypothetical protein